jgi:transcriptional regulator with XRE-family HTH domain
MTSQASTLGQFISELMAKYGHSNRSLAATAGVSESAIRNLLKFGVESDAKDPDARTLSRIARALDVDAIRLFRLAGYIPPQAAAHSVRADYLADIFDQLPVQKQDAVLGVLEAMTERMNQKTDIQVMRKDPENPLAGVDTNFPKIARLMANQLVIHYQMTEPVDIEKIEPDVQILHYKWRDLPQTSQERIKALIRHKLSLDYDPTMVDPDWRK